MLNYIKFSLFIFFVFCITNVSFAQISLNYITTGQPTGPSSFSLSTAGLTSLEPMVSGVVAHGGAVGNGVVSNGLSNAFINVPGFLPQASLFIVDSFTGSSLGSYSSPATALVPTIPTNSFYEDSAYDVSNGILYFGGNGEGVIGLIPNNTFNLSSNVSGLSPTYLMGVFLNGTLWFYLNPATPTNPLTSEATVQQVVVDSSSDIYVSGIFNGTVDFDPTTATDNRTGISYDVFISKFDIQGNRLWTITLGTNTYDYLNKMIIDSISGQILLLSRSSLALNNDDITFRRIDPSNGSVINQWSIGGASTDTAIDLVSTNNGWAMLAQSTSPTINFDPTALNPNASFTKIGIEDSFVVEYDLLDNFIAARQIGLNSTSSVSQGNISVNNCNEIIFASNMTDFANNNRTFLIRKYIQGSLTTTLAYAYPLPSNFYIYKSNIIQNLLTSGRQTLAIRYGQPPIYSDNTAIIGLSDAVCP